MRKIEEKNNTTLKLIPIYEKYMEYMIALILKLPRTEKFSIGTEFKTVMYETKVWWLTKQIINSQKEDKGIPIGNYTSQIYANIYLNELDQYIKHKLKAKYYFRYMDDSIILIKNKEELKEIFMWSYRLYRYGKYL